ncbi:MAG: hypothetical protein GX075_06305 [Firmicutes bacterium]|nr:hypothetical protein [Bacillota bacterium]
MSDSSLAGVKFGFKLMLGLACVGLGFLLAIQFLRALTVSPVIDLTGDEDRWVSFYDRSQKEIVKVFIREQSKVGIAQIPTALQRAFVLEKDPGFYNRDRNLASVLSAFEAEVKGYFGLISPEEYRRDIPATLAHNIFLTRKKAEPHRLDEMILAYKIERKYRREEILESYLNNIYFGDGAFGVEAAANYYFKKSALQLQPHEIAFLISMATDTLSPDIYLKEGLLQDPQRAKIYRNQVLDRMAAGGVITPKQAGEFKLKPLGIVTYH